jgi:hypothetical protein
MGFLRDGQEGSLVIFWGGGVVEGGVSHSFPERGGFLTTL